MSFQHRPLNGTDRFPAELMAQILDNTKHDTRTLHTCCLVCASWHSYLIDSLYETIHLKSRSQTDKVVSAVRIYPSLRDRLASVRSIMLRQHDWPAPEFAHVFPLVLGPHLHKVERLSFGGCKMQSLDLSFFIMLRQFKDVKRLELSMSSPVNFADFRRIVCALPQLEELDVARSLSRKPSQLAPPLFLNSPRVPKLTTVRIKEFYRDFFHDLVAWLSSSGVCSTIRTLEISSYVHYLDVETVEVLLAHTSSTLEHLRMVLPIRRLDEDWGFPQLLHLRTLDIILEIRAVMSVKDLQQKLHNILASLTSLALEHIRLILDLPRLYLEKMNTVTDRAQYADLHAVLARPIFASLHRVTVVLHDSRVKTSIPADHLALELLGFLHALFAPWCVRGIVSLACTIRRSNMFTHALVYDLKGLHWLKWIQIPLGKAPSLLWDASGVLSG